MTSSLLISKVVCLALHLHQAVTVWMLFSVDMLKSKHGTKYAKNRTLFRKKFHRIVCVCVYFVNFIIKTSSLRRCTMGAARKTPKISCATSSDMRHTRTWTSWSSCSSSVCCCETRPATTSTRWPPISVTPGCTSKRLSWHVLAGHRVSYGKMLPTCGQRNKAPTNQL